MLIKFFRPAIIAPVLCLIYALAVVGAYGDSLALVTIGARYAPPELVDRAYSDEGYDGQSVYTIARYGLAGAPYIDVPAYRYQRILLPALGGALSLGQSAWVEWALLVVNLVALGVGTAYFERLLQELRRPPLSRWYVVGFALSLGVFGAARLQTTETLAYGLVVAGIFYMQRDRWQLGGALFALAALGKETTLIFPFAYGLWMLYQRQWGRALVYAPLTLAPFLIWQGVLYAQFGEFGIGSGGEGATGFEFIPFMGFLRILTVEGGTQAFALLAPIIGPFVIVPTIWALWQCWRDFRQGTWTFWTLLLCVNAVLMLFIPFSTYRELLGILRFIVGLQIAVILYAAVNRKRRPLMYSTLWFVSSILVIFSDFAMLEAGV